MVISNFLLLPSVFAVFRRLDSFYTTSTQMILYVSRLFLVSLIPWIDKPWGNTLREKLHDPVRLWYINWGAKERQQILKGRVERQCVDKNLTHNQHRSSNSKRE